LKLLTIDEVTALWRCHRITVLRLMKRGVLDWTEVDGEWFFDEAEVLALKSSRIAVYPHLTVGRRKKDTSTPPKPAKPRNSRPPRRRR